MPVGVPVPWPTATPPAGWLQCNGATFTKEQYPVLARVYPTLRLPDLRGEFIRGWDDGRKIDEGRKLLSWQKGTLVGGHDDNDSSLDISYMSNGNNIDYGGDKVFAGNYRSDYLWYVILGGTNSRAKAELNGAFFKEGANKRGNSSRLTQSFHFFMFEPIFSPVNALNQPI
ncbi:phage tail protein [Escherichia coli]